MSDKPRLVEITSKDEYAALIAAQMHGDLDVPHMLLGQNDGAITIWADADELKAWRAARG